MWLTLEIKQKCSWFWLRSIQKVRIDKCCTECFIGKKDNRVYESTKFKSYALVNLEIQEDPKAVAYYLCGISKGMCWKDNTHIAFISKFGSRVEVNNDRIGLIITDAHEIKFQQYQPNPNGYFTQKQRRCRNWIFANYIRDGMLESIKN